MENWLDRRLAAAGLGQAPPARERLPPSASLRDSLLSPTTEPEQHTAQPTAQPELPTKEPKDPCKRIKRSEAPKFNGDRVKMPVEEFILEFMEYC